MRKAKKIRQLQKRPVLDFLFGADPFLSMVSFAMAVYGVVMIFSATRIFKTNQYVIIQSMAVILGYAAMLVVSHLRYKRFVKYAHWPLFFLSIALLVITLFIGTGDGNRSWIRFDFMPIGFQPAEFVKIFFILTFAYHLGRVRDRRQRPLTVLFLLFHAGIIIGLIVLQGDLGTALVFVCLFLFMLFAAGCSVWYFLIMGGATAVVSPFLWKYFLKPYQKERILCGFNPQRDPLGYGYQALCSQRAISGGGFWGQGYLQGTISQNPVNSALPARWTDMIFAVMGEELGFFGIMLYLLLLTALVMRILFVARKTRNSWGSLICIGVCAVFICQAMENIGMCLGMLPVIGLTLPFMSYGGSSVVTLFVLVGLVQCVERYHDTTYGEEF